MPRAVPLLLELYPCSQVTKGTCTTAVGLLPARPYAALRQPLRYLSLPWVAAFWLPLSCSTLEFRLFDVLSAKSVPHDGLQLSILPLPPRRCPLPIDLPVLVGWGAASR